MPTQTEAQRQAAFAAAGLSSAQIAAVNAGVPYTPSSSNPIQPGASWNLSSWNTTGSGAFATQPVLTIGNQTYSYSNPQDYINKLSELKAANSTGPLDQFITQFQNVIPEFTKKTTPTPTPSPTATQVPTAAPTPTVIDHPTTVLQPGSTDTASVKTLQDWLVAHGYMTQAQVNTGYGTYGPQTTAAVLALQKNLGIDYSSGPGYFGPITIAALANTHNATTPNTPVTQTPTQTTTPTTQAGQAADQWRDPQGTLHLFPKGSTLPTGWTLVAQNISAANLGGKTIEQVPGTQTTTPTGAAATSQSQPNDITQLLSLPNLGPGSTGAAVQTLQNWLVAHGFLTQADMNTGPGTYGPKTTAAVAAWQAANGIDTQGNPGYFGPLSKTFLQTQAQNGTATQTTPGQQTPTVDANGNPIPTSQNGTQTQTPSVTYPTISDLTTLTNQIRKLYGLPDAASGMTVTQQAIQDYQNIYTSLGIPTVKDAYNKAVQSFNDLNNELADKVADINEDPWLSEGVRVSRIEKMTQRYQTKLDIATNQMNLFKSLVDQGIAEAKDILGQIHNTQTSTADAVNQAIDIVQKQIDATNALQLAQIREASSNTTSSTSATKPIEVSPGATLFDPTTGKPIYTAPTAASQKPATSNTDTTSTPSSTTPSTTKFTTTQVNAGASNAGIPIADFQKFNDDDKNYFINGYSTFKTAQSNITSGKQTVQQVGDQIKTSNLSENVKGILYKKLGYTPSSATTPAPAPSSSGNGILDFFGNIWAAITGS